MSNKYHIVVPHKKEIRHYSTYEDLLEDFEYIGFCVPHATDDEHIHRYRGERFFIIPRGSHRGGAVNHEATWATRSAMEEHKKHYIAFPDGASLVKWILEWEFLYKTD